jgi:phosphatidate cytidylyltransferase
VKRVLTAAILIPLVILALFKAPPWLFTLLVLGVALLAGNEYLDIVTATGFKPFRALSYLFLLCLFVACGAFVATVNGSQVPVYVLAGSSIAAALALLVVLASPFVYMIASMRREPLSASLADASASFFLLPYVGLTLFGLPMLRSYDNGAIFILFMMLTVWAGDTAAFYVGRAFGKHKLAPRVSPGKSWEGSAASAIAAVLVAVLLFHFLTPIWRGFHSIHLVSASGYAYYMRALANARPDFPPAPWWAAAGFALCVNVAAQFGDLVESALKRGAGMKDSGALLPGHGGVLDRIDALLFAIPTGWLLYVSGYSSYFTSRGILIS